jgi:two-component system, OmpR family, response regulator
MPGSPTSKHPAAGRAHSSKSALKPARAAHSAFSKAATSLPPSSRAGVTAPPRVGANPTRRPSPASRGRVLVVDDDPLVLESVKEALEKIGFEVALRTQALGTSQWLSENDVDLVLLDILMPAMGGADLATFLKKRGLTRKISVILHSGKDTEELASLVRQTGASGAIVKTDDTAAFVNEFERMAERHFKTKIASEPSKKRTKS